MSKVMVSIFSACLGKPISLEQAERRGITLYFCLPCCPSDALECSHYLAILGVRGHVNSDKCFNRLAGFDCFSFQWLSYYMMEVPDA